MLKSTSTAIKSAEYQLSLCNLYRYGSTDKILNLSIAS